MKNIIKKTIIFILPVLVFLISVNLLGDPAHLFSKGYEEKIAKTILSCFNVTNVYNYDERNVQKYLIQGSKLCPEVLVLGSSRTMLINSSCFPGLSFFNNSVSGATVEDFAAIYMLYKAKECQSKKIIIGLDPGMINGNNGQNRWESLVREYNLFLMELKMDTVSTINNFSNYSELISPSYFQSSLKALFAKQNGPVRTQNRVNDTFTKLKDGSVCYDKEYRTASLPEVDKRAAINAQKGISGIENFKELSPRLIGLMEKLVAKLCAQNSALTFVLIPYHPQVYKIIENSNKYKAVIESELFYRKLANKYNINVVGSYNPKTMDFDGNYFYDDKHVNEKGIAIILKQMCGANKNFLQSNQKSL